MPSWASLSMAMSKRAEQDAFVGFAEHGDVVEGIAPGDDVIIHPLERGHGFALLFPDAQLIVHDVVILDNQPVAQQRWEVELAEQGNGELLERVGQDRSEEHTSELQS